MEATIRENNSNEMVTNFRVPKFRTIKECLIEVKKYDENTAVTEFFIRQLCKSNKITYFNSGSKSLVNLDSLLEYLGFIEVDYGKVQ